LSVSRLDRGKNIELSVIAATRLNLPLLIVGETNEPRYEAYLKSIAGPTVQFLGRRTDTEVKRLYAGAIAFLFTALKEDFGIAPLEALGYGVPVISYYGGGPKETLIDGKTGLFFRTHTPESLMGAIRKLKQLHFSPHALHAHAQKFAPSVFRARFRSYVTTAMHEQAKAR
jgi:glycosyltransferase involved in cell wall biosynthesis